MIPGFCFPSSGRLETIPKSVCDCYPLLHSPKRGAGLRCRALAVPLFSIYAADLGLWDKVTLQNIKHLIYISQGQDL